MDRVRQERLRPIAGNPPSLINLPTGCAFNPRCVYASDELGCRTIAPFALDLATSTAQRMADESAQRRRQQRHGRCDGHPSGGVPVECADCAHDPLSALVEPRDSCPYQRGGLVEPVEVAADLVEQLPTGDGLAGVPEQRAETGVADDDPGRDGHPPRRLIRLIFRRHASILAGGR